jgi:hypothetical protein
MRVARVLRTPSRCRDRLADGWRYSPEEMQIGDMKCTPLLQPYAELEQRDRRPLRQLCRATLKTLMSWGFHVDAPAVPAREFQRMQLDLEMQLAGAGATSPRGTNGGSSSSAARGFASLNSHRVGGRRRSSAGDGAGDASNNIKANKTATGNIAKMATRKAVKAHDAISEHRRRMLLDQRMMLTLFMHRVARDGPTHPVSSASSGTRQVAGGW